MFRLWAHSTEEYAVVLDYLQFDHDMAFNFLISQTDVATTLVLTDEQAEHLVWSGYTQYGEIGTTTMGRCFLNSGSL